MPGEHAWIWNIPANMVEFIAYQFNGIVFWADMF